jgi:hypothetical protein
MGIVKVQNQKPISAFARNENNSSDMEGQGCSGTWMRGQAHETIVGF